MPAHDGTPADGGCRFAAPLWLHAGEAAWHFLTLPADVSDDIEARAADQHRGFGSVRVRVTVGTTTWQTSVFPDSKRGVITTELRDELGAALDDADRDKQVKVVLLTAEGDAFCAGFGLDWSTLAQAGESAERQRVRDSEADVQMIGTFGRTFAQLHEIWGVPEAPWVLGARLELERAKRYLFDGVARHTQEGLDFVARAQEVGWREAVRERDRPFGDHGERGRDPG